METGLGCAPPHTRAHWAAHIGSLAHGYSGHTRISTGVCTVRISLLQAGCDPSSPSLEPDNSVKEKLPRGPSRGGLGPAWLPQITGTLGPPSPTPGSIPSACPRDCGSTVPAQPLLQVGELHDQAPHGVRRVLYAGGLVSLDPHSCPGGKGGRRRAHWRAPPASTGGALLSLEPSLQR